MDCRCSFKACGVILLHFKVDKMNPGVIFKKKNFFWHEWVTPLWKTPEITGKTRNSGKTRKILIIEHWYYLTICQTIFDWAKSFLQVQIHILIAFALYNEHFMYYCGFYFTPLRPSNSDFGYIEEGSPQQVTHLPAVSDLLLSLTLA
jgi:hypothetical protein